MEERRSVRKLLPCPTMKDGGGSDQRGGRGDGGKWMCVGFIWGIEITEVVISTWVKCEKERMKDNS